ncbi:hypothetical protein B0J13DRAFT_618185 [Dactylonectria estremocensis]|uniref:Uncharacterized protein n=1 Tax=Dactylonectria estremocensis TaxID=1079267 RepID=A0A9P9FD13_9HYPO|nr:hypothetical protein B0J13DRAFT_618185 [Dactylonectria estremocensis]
MSFTHNKPKVQEEGGRSLGLFTSNNGIETNALFEWTAVTHRNFGAHASEVKKRIPTYDDINRPEEARTLKIESIFCGSPAHIIYQCPRPFHTALRTESFVFFRKQDGKPDFESPYILDWTGPPSPAHQHPDYQADKPAWFYDVWSLMMVLSEIAEWRPLSRVFRDEEELRKMRAERRQMVTHPGLRGQRQFTAAVFQKGFGFLDNDRDTLEKLGKWEIKRFFDELCSLLVVKDK